MDEQEEQKTGEEQGTREEQKTGCRRFYGIGCDDFYAGILVDEESDLIVGAAPILRWSIHKKFNFFKGYAERKGWSIDDLGTFDV